MKWFEKNMKYFLIIILVLFSFKSCQSCNRDLTNKKIQKQIIHLQDSLDFKIVKLGDSIKGLKYELSFAKEQASAADKRAKSVQDVAEKIKTNTSITVKTQKDK
jgi:hypothetical protein